MKSRNKRSLVGMTLFGWMASVLAAGCATAGSDAKHGLGAGEWQARLPETHSAVHDLAYGRGGSARSTLSHDEAQALLEDVTRPKVARVARVSHAKVAAPAQQHVAAATVAAQQQPSAAEVTVAPASTLLAVNDVNPEARYADRDQRAQAQQEFRGGDAIVISASALVLVLLIVVLILLLR